MSQRRKPLVLMITKEEREKWEREDKASKNNYETDEEENESNEMEESESDETEEKPRAMIQKIVGSETNVMSKMFTYGKCDVLVIMDKEKKPWYRGRDVCPILGFKKARNAIKNHVSEKYKRSYADQEPGSGASLKLEGNPEIVSNGKIKPAKGVDTKIDSRTLFVSNSGLIQLVSKSREDNAMELWEFICDEVLPNLFSKGTYSLPAKPTDVAELTKSFYDDNMISDYKDKLAVYLAYIGFYKGKHVLKYGKTNDFVARDLQQHRKMYKQFNVIRIWESLANDAIENNIRDNFLSKNMSMTLTREELKITCKEKTKRELVALNEVNGLDYCLNMIDYVVKNTVIPQEQKYKEEINELKMQNEINALKMRVEHLEEMNKHLKENIVDLRRGSKK